MTGPTREPGAIERSFTHVQGIGFKLQAYLKRLGVRCWGDWFRLRDRISVPLGLRAELDRVLTDSVAALEARDLPALAAQLGSSEAWRLVASFPDLSVAYVDLEATGPTLDADITVACIWDSASSRSFVRDRDLEHYAATLEQHDVMVTFGGRRFDVPHSERLAGHPLSLPHIDLKGPLMRLGLRGGLKRIEERLGIERSHATRELRGSDAISLWQRHLAGEPGCLELLIDYNAEDARHLELLLAHVIRELETRELAEA